MQLNFLPLRKGEREATIAQLILCLKILSFLKKKVKAKAYSEGALWLHLHYQV